ncbi:MAG: hypothetical protein IJZ59_07980 [Alphaproteobacteria bacterium]|nr:hypothetical protein [Alphaproteobacteria bacterium]
MLEDLTAEIFTVDELPYTLKGELKLDVVDCEELSGSVYDEFGVMISADDICDDMTLGELLNRIYEALN